MLLEVVYIFFIIIKILIKASILIVKSLIDFSFLWITYSKLAKQGITDREVFFSKYWMWCICSRRTGKMRKTLWHTMGILSKNVTLIQWKFYSEQRRKKLTKDKVIEYKIRWFHVSNLLKKVLWIFPTCQIISGREQPRLWSSGLCVLTGQFCRICSFSDIIATMNLTFCNHSPDLLANTGISATTQFEFHFFHTNNLHTSLSQYLTDLPNGCPKALNFVVFYCMKEAMQTIEVLLCWKRNNRSSRAPRNWMENSPVAWTQ